MAKAFGMRVITNGSHETPEGKAVGEYVSREQLSSQIRVIEMSGNDAWMRDMGPSFLVDAHSRLWACDWKFNAWGGLVEEAARKGANIVLLQELFETLYFCQHSLLYEEKFYFTSGDTGFRAWKTQFGTIGVGICWD